MRKIFSLIKILGTVTVDFVAHATSHLAGGTDELLLDEDDMASDTNTKGATQQSIKTYADTKSDATKTEEFENKTIDGDNNTISNLEHGNEVDNPTSGVHGATGDVVGTSDTQSLTNKTLNNTNNTVVPSHNYVCRVYLSSDYTLSGDGSSTRIPLDITDFDPNGDFDTDNYEYECPVAGFYLATFVVLSRSYTNSSYARFKIDDWSAFEERDLIGSRDTWTSSGVAYRAAGAKIILTGRQFSGSNMTVEGGDVIFSHMSIALICR